VAAPLLLTKSDIDALQDMGLDVFRTIALECGSISKSYGLVGSISNHGTENMTTVKTLIVMICMAILSPLVFAQSAQDAPPPRVAPADAKNHIGEKATVCGKVVDTKTTKYGLAGHGKPVFFDLDQPEPNPVFYFIAFGEQPKGPEEAIAAYQGKQVCVTGKIVQAPTGGPFIMAADRSQIKLQVKKTENK